MRSERKRQRLREMTREKNFMCMNVLCACVYVPCVCERRVLDPLVLKLWTVVS